jgi:hypothetical protein
MRRHSGHLPAFPRGRSSHVRRHSLDVPLGALVFAMLRERFRVIVVVCDCFALVRIS